MYSGLAGLLCMYFRLRVFFESCSDFYALWSNSLILTLTVFELYSRHSNVSFNHYARYLRIAGLLGFFILLLYIELLSKFPGSLRKRTSYELLGAIAFVIGLLFDGQVIVSNPTVPMFYKV